MKHTIRSQADADRLHTRDNKGSIRRGDHIVVNNAGDIIIRNSVDVPYEVTGRTHLTIRRPSTLTAPITVRDGATATTTGHADVRVEVGGVAWVHDNGRAYAYAGGDAYTYDTAVYSALPGSTVCAYDRSTGRATAWAHVLATDFATVDADPGADIFAAGDSTATLYGPATAIAVERATIHLNDGASVVTSHTPSILDETEPGLDPINVDRPRPLRNLGGHPAIVEWLRSRLAWPSRDHDRHVTGVAFLDPAKFNRPPAYGRVSHFYTGPDGDPTTNDSVATIGDLMASPGGTDDIVYYPTFEAAVLGTGRILGPKHALGVEAPVWQLVSIEAPVDALRPMKGRGRGLGLRVPRDSVKIRR